MQHIVYNKKYSRHCSKLQTINFMFYAICYMIYDMEDWQSSVECAALATSSDVAPCRMTGRN